MSQALAQGVEVFGLLLVYCCEGCSEAPFSWRVLQKYVISSQSAHASGLTRTPWDYFGVHHHQTPADSPRLWPRCMLRTSAEPLGHLWPCCSFHGRRCASQWPAQEWANACYFSSHYKRLWHLAFAAHAPSRNSINIIFSFLMRSCVREKLLYNSVLVFALISFFPYILWWRVFWCMLCFCCRIPLCLGTSKNVPLRISLSYFHKELIRALPQMPPQSQRTAPPLWSFAHHTLLLTTSQQLLCAPDDSVFNFAMVVTPLAGCYPGVLTESVFWGVAACENICQFELSVNNAYCFIQTYSIGACWAIPGTSFPLWV